MFIVDFITEVFCRSAVKPKQSLPLSGVGTPCKKGSIQAELKIEESSQASLTEPAPASMLPGNNAGTALPREPLGEEVCGIIPGLLHEGSRSGSDPQGEGRQDFGQSGRLRDEDPQTEDTLDTVDERIVKRRRVGTG